MKKYRFLTIIGIIFVILLVMACSIFDNTITDLPLPSAKPSQAFTPTITTTPVSTPIPSVVGEQPALLSGEFTYTNDFYPEGYAYEHVIALLDMTGFVTRDDKWIIPVESQVLGFVRMFPDENRAEFRLQLPVRPTGSLNDVDNDGETDLGVQIFAIEYNANWAGGPFFEGDDPYRGWPGYLASITVDRENKNEVMGGQLIVWAQDGEQSFPTGFGADGLLFTADDPAAPIPAGYSVIDLDQEPFGIIRETAPKMTLYEPSDAAVKDYSSLSYSEAFDTMFETIRKEYAFNGIEGKQPDYDALYNQLKPRVEDAEKKKDAYAFYLVMRDFSLAFRDGHVGLSGGDLSSTYNRDNIAGGYGFAIRELSDGRVIVVYVQPDGPAKAAGMLVGAELLQVDGVDVSTAIGSSKPFTPQSTDFGLRYEQSIFFLRTPTGTKQSFTFRNPDADEQTETLKSIFEFDSLYATYLGGDYDEFALPVEVKVLDSGIGYVRINSNSDDLNLIYRLFEKAMITFENAEVLGIIIDMRLNFGGSSLGLAGFLTDQEITMGQLQYYSDKTGQFENEGDPGIIYPNQRQFRFDRMVLLVDQFCFSACELESYSFSQVPGMIVMGQFPTAGVEAETARGNFKLPEGIEITVPTGRFLLPDGSIFLEGQGVQPTVLLPVTEEDVLSEDDLVLQAAEEEILK